MDLSSRACREILYWFRIIKDFSTSLRYGRNDKLLSSLLEVIILKLLLDTRPDFLEVSSDNGLDHLSIIKNLQGRHSSNILFCCESPICVDIDFIKWYGISKLFIHLSKIRSDHLTRSTSRSKKVDDHDTLSRCLSKFWLIDLFHKKLFVYKLKANIFGI